MKVKDLSRADLKALIQEAVEETLLEIMGDPDEGKVLRDEVKERLRTSMDRVKQGERGKPFDEVSREVAKGTVGKGGQEYFSDH